MGKQVRRCRAGSGGDGKAVCRTGVESSPMRNPKVPGSAPALGCRRVRLAPDMSKMPPACGRIFFNSARGGACWCTRGRARSQGPGRCRAGSEVDGKAVCRTGVESPAMRNPKVPGSAPALGCRRVRLAPGMSKVPPACSRIFFQLSPRGRVLVHPRAGALPETMALSRYWRGGITPVSVVRLGSASACRVDFVAELEMSFDRGLWALAGGGRWLFFIDTTHPHIQI